MAIRQTTDREKAIHGGKTVTPPRSAQSRKRIFSIFLFALILIATILIFDATVFYLVLEVAKQVIHWIWWAMSAVGFYFFKVYSQLVTPDQWPSR